MNAFLRCLAPAALTLLAVSCSSPLPNRNPLGEVFPSVQGTSLEGRTVELPADLLGAPSVLLAGYSMEAQFDGDRWLVGLLQAGTPVRVLEVPTIPGFAPGVFAGSIDEGMRSGIPSEDWGIVVTLYKGDAARVVELTGNENDRNMRVFLLDAEGRIQWFHDRGFSAGKLLDLDREARALLGDQADG